MKRSRILGCEIALLSWLIFLAVDGGVHAADESSKNQQDATGLDYEIHLDTVAQHDEHDFLWFHPRAAAIPASSPDANPIVVMTIQKHLRASDHYSGMFVLGADTMGA